MADFLTENSMLLSSSFASSSFYFSNLTGGSDFDSVMKASTDEKLNMNELAGASTNNADAYTRIVSATVMSSQMMAQTGADGRVAYSYQGLMQESSQKMDQMIGKL